MRRRIYIPPVVGISILLVIFFISLNIIVQKTRQVAAIWDASNKASQNLSDEP